MTRPDTAPRRVRAAVGRIARRQCGRSKRLSDPQQAVERGLKSGLSEDEIFDGQPGSIITGPLEKADREILRTENIIRVQPL